MRSKVRERTQEEAVKEEAIEDQCHHYWVIEMANGPQSQGVCRHCGEEKVFLNTIPDFAVIKRHTRPIALPELAEVEMDKDSES